MERTGSDEQDVVGLHRAVLGGHVAAFHQRQQVALHALAADVATTHVATALGHLVDLVDEHDAAARRLDGRAADVVLVDQLAALPRSAAGGRP
jgi:hypothetical protein